MSRFWNKAYVQAYYPCAYASNFSNGRSLKTWVVYFGRAFEVNQRVPRRSPTAMQAWRAAAEAIEKTHQKLPLPL